MEKENKDTLFEISVVVKNEDDIFEKTKEVYNSIDQTGDRLSKAIIAIMSDE